MPFSDVVATYSKKNITEKSLVASLWVPELNMSRITLTPPAINNAACIIFLVSSIEKADVVREVLEEKFQPERYPAQLIEATQGKTIWFLDEMAASKLSTKLQHRLTPDHIRPFTLSIDIGGSAIKMMIIDANGIPVTDYFRMVTPRPASFDSVFNIIHQMIQSLTIKFDRISAGFPGVVLHGVIRTAPNMHSSWEGINFQKELQKLTGVDARVANDADVQGYGDISGEGVELVITLGTGLGSALFTDGQLVPNLEMGHHPFVGDFTYEDLLGRKALEKDGIKKWGEALQQAIALLQKTFNYDKLYIGGGYSRLVNIPLPESVKLALNIEGVLGGIKLWEK